MRFGKKSEFVWAIKERVKNVIVIVFGQTKLLKDKKSGIIHVMMFYGFLLVQFGAIDVVIKGLSPGNHLPLGPFYTGFVFFQELDRKSTRLNSSHVAISYAVFCLKKKRQ